MAEAGGPTTQAGIHYQNTIAALYIGRMLDLRARAARDRVINVRLEAPEVVDDIVARMGDGARRFIQAKSAISLGTDPWTTLWHDFSQQLLYPGVVDDDRLVLVVGEPSTLATNLHECCTRATSATDDNEYLARISTAQRRIVDSICGILEPRGHDLAFIRKMLSRTDIEVIPESTVERDYAPLWMPVASLPPDRLLIILRDIAGGASRFRTSFEPAALRDRLSCEHKIDISIPTDWGVAHYRSIIVGRAVIDIPGTGVSKRIDSTFPWPKAIRYDRERKSDFDDEAPRYAYGIRSDEIDLSLFPSPALDRLIVIAGPGFGKSVLTTALAAKLAAQGRLPVVVSIPELANLDVSIGEYLNDHINTTHQISVDWMRAAETGLLVLLLDGLDEVASDRRTVVLERIKTFGLRNPTTPWLVTVRDAAALAAPAEALMVELESLGDDDIVRHIEFYRPENPDLSAQLRRQFEVRPDVLRLVRIPLFLALLLALLRRPNEIPSSRTELLETYLDLLFRPEQFKLGEFDSVDSTIIRPIAEAAAFNALECDEIGLNTRTLERHIRNIVTNMPAQPIIERLVKCGILRKTAPGRYVFPFPIVQEYLAACLIIDARLHEVPERLDSTAKRPWAQALQFVLEKHPVPNDLVRDMLAREDDAFSTNLRLIARCVANGMQIDEANWLEISRRLANIWSPSSWRQRRRIGELIAEAFCNPLIPEIRNQLSNRWLLHDGAGAVVARINDPTLTKAILCELLDGDIDHLWNLGELQDLINRMGDEVLSMYIDRITRENVDGEMYDAITCLIEHLDEHQISVSASSSIALNENYPLAIRLAAFTLCPNPIDDRVQPLINSAIIQDEFLPRSIAIKALAKSRTPLLTLRSILVREDIPLEQLKQILNYLPASLRKNIATNLDIDLAHDKAIHEELRQIILVFSACHGHDNSMDELISNFAHLPIEIVGAAISLFGHHRCRSLVIKAINILRKRTLSASDRVMLASQAVTGMTTIFEMDFFNGGTLKSTPHHPGLDVFQNLLEEWGGETDYEPFDAMKMNEHLARLGVDSGVDRLPSNIEQLLSIENFDFDDCNNAHAMGEAVSILQERGRFVPLSTLELIITRCSHNGASQAAKMIAAMGNRDALESLLQIHVAARDSLFRSSLLDNIELLAGRLGLRVRKSNNRLEVSIA